MSPKDDVCATYETIRKQIVNAVEEEEKLQFSQELLHHIEHAREEHSYYMNGVQESREEFLSMFLSLHCNSSQNQSTFS